MNNAEAREWLDAAWDKALDAGSAEPDDVIDRLINSKVTSIRYAIVTQLLGKIADANRSLLCVQSGDEQEFGAWNARSFCDAVIVPWVSENHDVLGTSTEPYASKPLRRPRLDEGVVRDKAEWAALVAFLTPLDSAAVTELEKAFIRCLESMARRLASQSFKYRIPMRASLSQLCQALVAFLGEPSGGLRPLAVTAAMMRVLGRAFSLFSRVESQGVNEADSLTGAPGDVMCYDDSDNMVLAVEVKDRALTLSDVRSSTRKARESSAGLSNLLFAAPAIQAAESDRIQESMATAWASGLNVNRIDVVELAAAAFALLEENWRQVFLREIGKELDDRGDHAHRRAWHTVLSDMVGDR